MILTCSSCRDRISAELVEEWVSLAEGWVSLSRFETEVQLIDILYTLTFENYKALLENRTILCPKCLIIKDIIQ